MSNIISTRIHRILAARREQIARNIAAWRGGQPYIDLRLWRAPNESELSWTGTRSESGKQVFVSVGRKQRAAMINDAGRVVSKITQYLFKTHADRTGIDDAWGKDVTGRGQSVGSFWVDVSELLTAGQWVWLQVDRLGQIKDPITGEMRQRTLLEKQRDSDQVRWTAWPSLSVPDWSFDSAGRLQWVITEGEQYVNDDPKVEAETYKLRTLWERTAGGYRVTQYRSGKDGESVQIGDTVAVIGDGLPFVLVGKPDEAPWWFDDVESIQAQLLNLDSLHYENLVRTVFPQLVIPTGMLDSLQSKLIERVGAQNGEKIVELVKEIVRGLDAPIVESADEAGVTRFIMPAASDQKTIPDELQRKRALLFDMVGLSLFNKETRQIQTAESKQFDQLDTESTLKHRAIIMQAAEERLVEITLKVDPTFAKYTPVWPTSFDVVDMESDSAAIAMIGNLPDITLSMRKIVLLAALRIISERGGYDQDLIEKARQEIKDIAEEPPVEAGGDGLDF